MCILKPNPCPVTDLVIRNARDETYETPDYEKKVSADGKLFIYYSRTVGNNQIVEFHLTEKNVCMNPRNYDYTPGERYGLLNLENYDGCKEVDGITFDNRWQIFGEIDEIELLEGNPQIMKEVNELPFFDKSKGASYEFNLFFRR